jgi:hypothetical protein
MAVKKTKKPTITEIKRLTVKKSPYFFDAKTLKAFGQKMSSFKVHKSKTGRIFIYAKSYSTDYRTGKKEYMGYSIRELKNNDLIYSTKYKSVSDLPD